MTTKIEKDNTIVAVFDGYINTGKLHPFNSEYGYTYRNPEYAGVKWAVEFNYSKSWDKLIPVWSKFREWYHNKDTPLPKDRKFRSEFNNAVDNGNIDLAFQILLDGVIFYNSTLNKKD